MYTYLHGFIFQNDFSITYVHNFDVNFFVLILISVLTCQLFSIIVFFWSLKLVITDFQVKNQKNPAFYCI